MTDNIIYLDEYRKKTQSKNCDNVIDFPYIDIVLNDNEMSEYIDMNDVMFDYSLSFKPDNDIDVFNSNQTRIDKFITDVSGYSFLSTHIIREVIESIALNNNVLELVDVISLINPE